METGGLHGGDSHRHRVGTRDDGLLRPRHLSNANESHQHRSRTGGCRSGRWLGRSHRAMDAGPDSARWTGAASAMPESARRGRFFCASSSPTTTRWPFRYQGKASPADQAKWMGRINGDGVEASGVAFEPLPCSGADASGAGALTHSPATFSAGRPDVHRHRDAALRITGRGRNRLLLRLARSSLDRESVSPVRTHALRVARQHRVDPPDEPVELGDEALQELFRWTGWSPSLVGDQSGLNWI